MKQASLSSSLPLSLDNSVWKLELCPCGRRQSQSVMNETYDVRVHYLSRLKHAGKLWYIVNPNDTSFQFPADVPDYHMQVCLLICHLSFVNG